MLTKQHIQECLSRAHLIALGGRAGIDVALGEGHDYGVDGTLRIIRVAGGRRVKSGIALDVQLKASTNWFQKDEEIVYDLEAKNYNDIIGRNEGIGLILILLCLPRCEHLWLAGNAERLLLRNCCYWFRPEGQPVPNSTTKRIKIPIGNRVTVQSIATLIAEARARETANER